MVQKSINPWRESLSTPTKAYFCATYARIDTAIPMGSCMLRGAVPELDSSLREARRDKNGPGSTTCSGIQVCKRTGPAQEDGVAAHTLPVRTTARNPG